MNDCIAPSMRPDGSVDWSTLPPPLSGLRCIIVLPARNESALVTCALQAINDQRGAPFPFEVIVLANNCTDDTAARVRKFAENCRACAVHVVEVTWPTAFANVGRARRALMDVASARLRAAGTTQGIVVSTDADTRVAADWLAMTAVAIDAGADAVGGRIVAEADGDLPAPAQRLMGLDDSYRTWREHLACLVDPDAADPWPRHHQHFGASLAVTAHAYCALGAQPLVPFLEDEALVRALRLEDRVIRHCPSVRVHTSARLDGRAEVGLSWQLRAWSGPESVENIPLVTNPVIEAHHWALRRQARVLWREVRAAGEPHNHEGADPIAGLADALRIDGRWLKARLATSTSFGRLWDDVERHWGPSVASAPLATPTLPMDTALSELQQLVRAHQAA